jgi:hypothetical protein
MQLKLTIKIRIYQYNTLTFLSLVSTSKNYDLCYYFSKLLNGNSASKFLVIQGCYKASLALNLLRVSKIQSLLTKCLAYSDILLGYLNSLIFKRVSIISDLVMPLL